jgi:hypothetical protein
MLISPGLFWGPGGKVDHTQSNFLVDRSHSGGVLSCNHTCSTNQWLNRKTIIVQFEGYVAYLRTDDERKKRKGEKTVCSRKLAGR